MTPDDLRAMEQLIEDLQKVRSPQVVLVLRDALAECAREIRQLHNWIADLQSGMFINCVYCGHRYGRADQMEESRQAVLKAHIAQCLKHPMHDLLKIAQATWHLCESLIACQEGVGIDLFVEIRDAAQAAIQKAKGES